MPLARSLARVIHLSVLCLLLAIGAQTWLVMGFVRPLAVHGSSMVPTLHGAYVTATCPTCGQSIEVGAEFSATTPTVPCPHCAVGQAPLESLPIHPGDSLWVNRTAWLWHAPQRWELVVLRNPHDGEQLCVKRIVGLPGEHLTLQQGNLVADGHVLSKPEPLQKKLRCALHTETQQNLRWHAGAAGGWQYTLDHWQHTGGSPDSIDWLTYQHGQPITDDLPYNAGITRRLNLVHALQLAARVQWPGPGTLFFRLDDGQTSAQVAIQLPAGTLTLTVDNRAPAIVQLPSDLLQKLAQQPVWFEFSNFDQRLLLKIEGQQLLQCPWPMTKALGTAQPFAIGVQVAGIEFAGVQGARIQGAAGQGAAIRLLDLRLYRDRYDSQHPVGTPPLPSGGWQLASDQYFLLGDNSPISLDSRLWGPVSGRLLLGKPIFLGR